MFATVLSFALTILYILDVDDYSGPPRCDRIRTEFVRLIRTSCTVGSLLFNRNLPASGHVCSP